MVAISGVAKPGMTARTAAHLQVTVAGPGKIIFAQADYRFAAETEGTVHMAAAEVACRLMLAMEDSAAAGSGNPSGNAGLFGGHGGNGNGGGGAGLGGAIFNDSGTVIIHNSTFYNNEATQGLASTVPGPGRKLSASPL